MDILSLFAITILLFIQDLDPISFSEKLFKLQKDLLPYCPIPIELTTRKTYPE